MMRTATVSMGALLVAASGLAQPPQRLLEKFAHLHGANDHTQVRDTVYCCMPGENLLLEGGRYQLDVSLAGLEGPLPIAGVQSRGGLNTANRIDVVAVGDGYTAGQMTQFHNHANSALDAFLAYPPFDTYASYFNTHLVDVVSQDSGVDHDPSFGIYRNTAMDMAFWTSGIERLLGVNVGKAYSFANAAPDVDLVLAVANSSKYGGAGYTSADLATMSGANSLAADIAIHEFGHSLGDLADEYDYGGPQVYQGGEPSRSNLSKLTALEMDADGTKWVNWLSTTDSAWDGLHWTYEGGGYSEQGIYRPTNNSMMRSLGRPFNLVGAEGIIIEIYRIVDPIDDASHISGLTLSGTETVWVTPMQPVGHDLEISWELDGNEVWTETSLDLATLPLTGTHQLVVRVTDPTTLVRNEAARASLMTDIRFWTIQYTPPLCDGDVTGDGAVDFEDLNAVLINWGGTGPGGDANDDGSVDFEDLNLVLALWETTC